MSKVVKKKTGKKSSAQRKSVSGKNVKNTGRRMPATLEPMLATLVDAPPTDSDWLFEVKWDGYRAISILNRGEVEIKSRNNKSFNEKFYPIHEALKKLKFEAILDGEIIVINENGVSDFGSLQNWRSEADGELVYYVFDLLWYNGENLMDLPLIERQSKLAKILPAHPLIHISQAFPSAGNDFLEAARKMQLEGIMAKKSDSLYKPGARSKEWLKIKTGNRQEVVIGGFTRNQGSGKKFSALLVGVYEGKKLVYTGKIGTGFSDALQKEMMDKFKPLIRNNSPFDVVPDINKPSRFRPNPPKAEATWLKPELVCEVSFTELTSDGVMRHPSFEGMRGDKRSSQVKLEKKKSIKTVAGKKEKTILEKKKIIKAGIKSERKSLLNPSEKSQEKKINSHLIKFNNLDKIYWPKEKYTKRDMLNYYYQVAEYMLPYLKDRPQSLNRYPNGINGPSFYQKDVTGKVPDWIKKFPYKSEDEPQQKNYMVCTKEAGLLYMASLGCIEMNPWSSRVSKPDNPDWCIIDLDPDKNPFSQVIETAQVTRQILDAAKIPSYCKTSGSTGIHIYIPFGAKYDYEDSREFGRVIARIVQKQLPKFTSIERPTAKRKGKIYIDFLQNRPQATLASAYSLRPKPGAPVSMPLYWEEVKKGLSILDFNITNAVARIRETGDLFKPVLGKGIDLKKSLKALAALEE